MADSAPAVRLVSTEAPDLPTSTWTNGIRIGNELVLSGMTAYPAARDAALDTYGQTLVVLGKIKSLVEAAGGSINNICRLVVYVTDIADKEAVGRARREFFASVGAFPCSTLVEVSKLVFPELTVEIDGFARLDFDLGALGA
ncbi:RidA family protein [Chitinasiproducens palmae]|uniref:Enamine deaminase RidA, house cleaning of reactive enamine intermediates, YjgF/YER057c/UK114 family n=1 Tax=Chitinasiproducens palmae TaxID=1770053 RepID=A0A1H2PPF9_9BURK|nr:RidA family protein [Chitinasiproducens palmae]SDV48644.1 Enamine deaminase RidA, house cleaning of reactive enamine intermediates, YjgF/YER057c/UK114 family [Chitinasiproducens palmae]